MRSEPLYKYFGEFIIHSEMGCGSWLQFHDNRGLHGEYNQYWNWDWTLNFNKRSHWEVKMFLGDKMIFEGILSGKNGSYFQTVFLPNKLNSKDFTDSLIGSEIIGEVVTSERLPGLDKLECEEI